MLKQRLGEFCEGNRILKKLIFDPYAEYSEKKTQAARAASIYSLDDREQCLSACKRAEGVNFWFLLEQGHNNIGDIAIGLAEEKFFDENFRDYAKHYVYEEVYNRYKKEFAHMISPRDVIVLRGGGSIGNTYRHELLREEIIAKFHANLIISMPQTMSFPDGKAGKKGLKKAQKAYGKCKRLLLVAREERTYNDMVAAFGGNVLLTPDIVMSMKPELPKCERSGVLLCLRGDWEKSLTPDECCELENACLMFSPSVAHTDMYASEKFVPREARAKVLNDKLMQFASSQLVITDRLHGMVLSAITGTPCIALPNYNHKVAETYKWLKNLPYIAFCNEVSEAVRLIPNMSALSDCEWDNSFAKPYYDKIVEYIKRNMNGQ